MSFNFRYYLTFVAYPESDRIARKYLGNDLPYIGDIARNMSLFLRTSNPILDSPRPMVPTIISLEHIHIKPVDPLPKVCIFQSLNIIFVLKFILRKFTRFTMTYPNYYFLHSNIQAKFVASVG